MAQFYRSSTGTTAQITANTVTVKGSKLSIDEGDLNIASLNYRINQKEDNLGLPPSDDYVLVSDTSGNRSWISQSAITATITGQTLADGTVDGSFLIWDSGTTKWGENTEIVFNTSNNSLTTHSSNVVTGEKAIAFGGESIGLGTTGNIANGELSMVWGTNNTGASLTTVWGALNKALSTTSTAWGANNTATAQDSTVWGNTNSVLNDQATAWGANNEVLGDTATAWGSQNTAVGSDSTVWGVNNRANAVQSTAWGQANRASGFLSTVFGFSNTASTLYSVAWGDSNIASGTNATVFGFNNTANSYLETVFGHFATNYTPTNDIGISINDRILTIGNGDDITNRSDATRVWKSGYHEFNGTINIGNTTGGTGSSPQEGDIRYDGANYQGYKNSQWINLDVTGGTGSVNDILVTGETPSTQDIDWDIADVYQYTLTGNTTFSFSNLPTGLNTKEITVYLVQDSVGNHTPTFPSSVSWGELSPAPIWTTAATQYDVVIFRHLGSLTKTTGVYVGGSYEQS